MRVVIVDRSLCGNTHLVAAPPGPAVGGPVRGEVTAGVWESAALGSTRKPASIAVRGLVAVGTLAVVGAIAGRGRQLNWGSRLGEQHQPLAGDDLIDRADLTATRAIDIRCPSSSVWPWIAQIGQGRGGLYSYDALENLVGCDIHSADRIVPEWQGIAAGDEVRLAPAVALTVAAVQPGRALVLSGGVPVGRTPPPYDFTWSFVIQDAPDARSRLVVRERYAYRRAWARPLVELTEIVSFVMTQKMLRGVRDRAEASP